MHRQHAGLPHGRPLPCVGPDAVSHDRAVVPQAEFGIGLPILLAVRVKPGHQLHFRGVLRQMGLHGQSPLRRQTAQEAHQPVCAGGREPGGQNGLHMGEVLTGLQPPQRFPLRVLRGFLKLRHTVPVHVYLAHQTADAGFFQLFHQDERGVGVQGGEHAHTGGSPGNQLPGQAAVGLPGKLPVREPGLGGEGIAVEPIQQRHVHAHAHHGVLGRVQVHVREGLHHQPVAVIHHGTGGKRLRQTRIQALNHAVLQNQKAPLQSAQLSQRRSIHKMTFQHDGFHCDLPFSA